MIILPEREILIVTPPKTAGRSVADALCRSGQAIVAVGPSMDGRGVDTHNVEVPTNYKHCKRLALVRHPLDRLVSLWHHLVRHDALWGRATQAFWFFANRVAKGEEPDPFYRWNLTRQLETLEDFAPIHFESIVTELAAHGISLPEGASLPHIGESTRWPWPKCFEVGLVETMRPWAAPDAESFGYQLALV